MEINSISASETSLKDDNISDLSFEDIREYLYETNAIQEAETTYLKNILEGNNKKKKNNVIINEKPSPKTSNGEVSIEKTKRSDWIDNMKIADLLESMDPLSVDKKKSLKRNKSSSKVETPEDLEMFEKEVQKELAEIERRKQVIVVIIFTISYYIILSLLLL